MSEPETESAEEESTTAPVGIPDKEYFRIGETAQLVGVGSSVLRSWESEFDIEPERSSSGQRMYRRQQIVLFLRLRTLITERGFTTDGARRLLAQPEIPMDEASAPLHDVMGQLQLIRNRLKDLNQRIEKSGPSGRAGKDKSNGTRQRSSE